MSDWGYEHISFVTLKASKISQSLKVFKSTEQAQNVLLWIYKDKFREDVIMAVRYN